MKNIEHQRCIRVRNGRSSITPFKRNRSDYSEFNIQNSTFKIQLTTLIVSLLCLASCQREAERIRVVPQVAPAQPRRVQFAPGNGNRLLVMEATGLVTVWDIGDPLKPVLFASIPASAIDTCFSSDGQGVATVGIDGHVRWWGADGQLRWTSTGRHEGMARAIAVRGERIVSGGEDGKIRFWTPAGAPAQEPLAAHAGAVLSVDLSPAGDLVSMGTDETVRRWKRAADGSYAPAVLYQEPNPKHVHWLPSLLRLDVQWGWDHAAVFAPRGDAIAGAVFDGKVRVWDAGGTERAVIAGSHAGHHVRALAFAPTGDFVASAGFDGRIRLWNLDGTPRLVINDAHRGPALTVAISPAGDRLASAGNDEALRLWRIDGSRLAELPRARSDKVHSVAFAPHAPLLAVGEAAGGAHLWNLDGSPHGSPLLGHKGPVLAVAFSPRGDLVATAGKDATVRLWQLDGTAKGEPIKGHIDGVLSVAFATNGAAVASGSRNDSLRIWDLTGKPLFKLDGLRDIVSDIVFSPKGDVFAASDGPGEIMIWNADGSVHTRVFKAHNGFLHALAFAPSGETLASAGADALVKLWDLNGTPQGQFAGHVGSVQSVAFSSDGTVLASGGLDGTVRSWTLATGQERLLSVGVPIDQVGFFGPVLWVRANGETLSFFDRDLKTIGTMLLRRDVVLAFTPDGWLGGPPQSLAAVKLFHASGAPLTDQEANARLSPQRVGAALGGVSR